MRYRLNPAVMMTCVLLPLAIAALSGCGQGDSGSHAGGSARVAVIDLDRVAQATGRSPEIQQQLTQRIQEAAQQARMDLEQLQNQANAELTRLAEQAGASPTPEQQRQIQAVRQRAQLEAQRRQVELNQRQQAIAAELRDQFRDEIRPTLNVVARDHGMSLVLVLNDNVVIYDTALDLTDALVAALGSKTQ